MEGDIKVVGIEEALRNIKALQDKLSRKALIKAMRPGAKEFQKAVKREAPKRLGYLKRSAQVRVIKRKRGESKASAALAVNLNKKTYPWKGSMVKPFYAYYVHNGTPKIRANPFVERAFTSVAERVKELILTNINIR